jgi:hypothetical protein
MTGARDGAKLLPGSLHCAGQRTEDVRRKKLARFGREDSWATLCDIPGDHQRNARTFRFDLVLG